MVFGGGREKMSLTVNVKNAKNLPNVEKFSLSDPFAVLHFGDGEF